MTLRRSFRLTVNSSAATLKGCGRIKNFFTCSQGARSARAVLMRAVNSDATAGCAASASAARSPSVRPAADKACRRLAQWGTIMAVKKFLPSPYTRSEEHTSELQSLRHLVCRLLLEKKKER